MLSGDLVLVEAAAPIVAHQVFSVMRPSPASRRFGASCRPERQARKWPARAAIAWSSLSPRGVKGAARFRA